MQQFTVVLVVTVNTVDTVSPAELQTHLAEHLEDFDAGKVEVHCVNEM